MSSPALFTVCVECLFLRSPSRAPYRTPSACAKRATYPDPPPVVLHPESIAAQAAYAVCVEYLIGKQNKATLYQVTEPSSVPYRTHSACANMAAYPDPPPVIPLPESIAAQAVYQLRYKSTEYCSWVRSRGGKNLLYRTVFVGNPRFLPATWNSLPNWTRGKNIIISCGQIGSWVIRRIP